MYDIRSECASMIAGRTSFAKECVSYMLGLARCVRIRLASFLGQWPKQAY